MAYHSLLLTVVVPSGDSSRLELRSERVAKRVDLECAALCRPAASDQAASVDSRTMRERNIARAGEAYQTLPPRLDWTPRFVSIAAISRKDAPARPMRRASRRADCSGADGTSGWGHSSRVTRLATGLKR